MSMNWESCSYIDQSTKAVIPTLSCIPPLIATVIYWALVFAGIVALFMIIFTGIKYINSGGDPKSIESAKKTLTYAIIGLILILGSFFIINLISFVAKAPCINAFGFTNCDTGQATNP